MSNRSRPLFKTKSSGQSSRFSKWTVSTDPSWACLFCHNDHDVVHIRSGWTGHDQISESPEIVVRVILPEIILRVHSEPFATLDRCSIGNGTRRVGRTVDPVRSYRTDYYALVASNRGSRRQGQLLVSSTFAIALHGHGSLSP